MVHQLKNLNRSLLTFVYHVLFDVSLILPDLVRSRSAPDLVHFEDRPKRKQRFLHLYHPSLFSARYYFNVAG